MNEYSDIRKAIVAEFVRLSQREAELRVILHVAQQELSENATRQKGLTPALEAYRVGTEVEADVYIARHYTLGWPTALILDVLSDTTGRAWTENDLRSRAELLGLQRPEGWQASLSDEQFKQENNSDDWLDSAFGIPPFSDDITSEPMKRLPAPQLVAEPNIVTKVLEDDRDFDFRVSPPLRNRWTKERISIVERDWPTYRLTNDIMADLNVLPGEKIWWGQIGSFANTVLRLRRPSDYRTQIAQMKGSPSAGWCTAERRTALIRDYQVGGISMREIRDTLNVMEGPPLPASSVIGSYAQVVLGLSRSFKIGPSAVPEINPEALRTARSEIIRLLHARARVDVSPFCEAPIHEKRECVQPPVISKTVSLTYGNPEAPKLLSAEHIQALRDKAQRIKDERATHTVERPPPAPAPPQPRMTKMEAIARVSALTGMSATSRDGSISVVAMEAARVAHRETERVEWQDVILWATENKMRLAEYKTKGDLMTAVNDLRTNASLPPWHAVDGIKVIRGRNYGS